MKVRRVCHSKLDLEDRCSAQTLSQLKTSKDLPTATMSDYIEYVIYSYYINSMPWPQTGATYYHAQLGLPDKGRAIKGLVVSYVAWL